MKLGKAVSHKIHRKGVIRDGKHPHPYFYRLSVKNGKRYRTVVYAVSVWLPTMTVKFGEKVEKRLMLHRIEVEGETTAINHR